MIIARHTRNPSPAALLAGAALALLAGAAQAAEIREVRLDGQAGGKRFDGIGVVEGGGATGVLLKDYPEPQRSQILDLLFKPKFGASVGALYVEIPGDGNSTQGSIPSHMHARDDIDYRRGYMWWEMVEAKKRNPRLTLDGAAWSAPGWIGSAGKVYDQSTGKDYRLDQPFYSQDMEAYYVSWLKGLRDVYGLSLDAIGPRNEKGASYDFAKNFRRALDDAGFSSVRLHGFDNWPDPWKFRFVDDMAADPELRDAIDIVSAHNNAPKSFVPAEIQAKAAAMGKPMWNTEQHVYEPGYSALIGLVEAFNDNYVRSGFTKVVNWYGIAGVYETQPYSGEKEAAVRANWPWSGHYAINPSLWGYAHYGQFTQMGWTYLDGAGGELSGGGSFVTLKSPGPDYSVIVETRGATAPQTLRLSVGGGLSTSDLAVWRSTETEHFVRQPDLAPKDGALTVTLEPNAVYSLTTTRGQSKGGFDGVPPMRAFPFPYAETFEGYGAPHSRGWQPRYLADISGAFELARCPARKGTCLRQAAPVPPLSWAPDWKPYTILGDATWRDYAVSADVRLAAGERAGVMGRIVQVGTGYGVIPKGYYFELAADGEARLVVVRGKVDKKKLIGDAEQQALIKAGKDVGEGGEKPLAHARLPGATPGQWRRLELRFEGETITGLVDGKPVLTATDALYPAGMAGLMAGPNGKALSTPFFDNLKITGDHPASPTPPLPPPIYAAER
jgi:galactosylceramidase